MRRAGPRRGVGAGHRAKERRLARVGVPDERDRWHGNFGASAPAGLSLQLQLLETTRQDAHTLTDESAVGLELRFTRSAQPDAAAALALEVGPAPHETCRDVLQLCEFHLQLALVTAGALRKDVENESVAVEYAPARQLLEIALLARRQRVVNEDHLGCVRECARADFLGLAAADEIARIRPFAPPRDCRHGLRARGERELREFPDVFGVGGCAEAEAHEHCTFTGAWAFEHYSACGSAAAAASSAEGTRTLRAGTTVEMACL